MPVQTRRRKAIQDATGDEDADITQQSFLESSPAQKLPVREKEDEADTPTKGTLKVFGDEGEDELKAPIKPSSNTASASAAIEKAEVEDEEEDSDDEAPEAVSTAKAAVDIKKSTQAAQKAAQEYVFFL